MTNERRDQLSKQIEEMGPWHHDIQLFDDFSTGQVFSPDGRLGRADNEGVSLISPRVYFLRCLDQLYPDGMSDKRFIDCACNGGGYCFWASERDISQAVGFDVREHWINQARFVQQHRTVFPTDRIEFHVMDLYDVPKKNFESFDLTYFSGLFYHLPDPINGLKIAADLTSDVIILNTAMAPNKENPRGMSLGHESTTKLMSGVHTLKWFANGKETLRDILRWLGFKEMKVRREVELEGGKLSRIEIIAARKENRLENVDGEPLV